MKNAWKAISALLDALARLVGMAMMIYAILLGSIGHEYSEATYLLVLGIFLTTDRK